MTSRASPFPCQRPGPAVRALFRAGAALYRGPLAVVLARQHILVLVTTGRRSGRPRASALTFAPIDGRYLVGAGMGLESAWYQNLLACPRVAVRVGGRRFEAIATPVLEAERRRALVPALAVDWDRYGPPRPLRWLMRALCGFDFDREVAHARAHAEHLPLVELLPLPPGAAAPAAL